MNRIALLCLPLLLTAACASVDRDVAAPQDVPSPTASGPAGSEPAVAFTVAPDGTADADAIGTALKRCLSLPGVEWKQPFAATPAVYRVAMGGAPITAFGDCMKDVPGYAAVPMSDAHASFVDQCAGKRSQYVVPSYIGIAEDVAMRTKPADADPRVGAVRVVARDGDCLAIDADLRPNRVDLLVQEGQVIWAILPDPTLTGSTTGQGIRWTGAEICVVGTPDCRTVDADTAQSLEAMLLAAEPAPPGTAYCEALSTAYRVMLLGPGMKPVPYEVPDGCGPVLKGGKPHLLDAAGVQAVKAAFETGTPADLKAPSPQRLDRTDEFGAVAGTTRLPNGTLRVQVNRVDWLTGDQAQAAAEADGTDAGGYYVVDDNPRTRTYDISPTAKVYGSIGLTGVPDLSARTVDDLTRFLRNGSRAMAGQNVEQQVRGTYFHFQIGDGLVVGIEEQYRP